MNGFRGFARFDAHVDPNGAALLENKLALLSFSFSQNCRVIDNWRIRVPFDA